MQILRPADTGLYRIRPMDGQRLGAVIMSSCGVSELQRSQTQGSLCREETRFERVPPSQKLVELLGICVQIFCSGQKAKITKLMLECVLLILG